MNSLEEPQQLLSNSGTLSYGDRLRALDMGGGKKDEASGTQWYSAKGEEEMSTN